MKFPEFFNEKKTETVVREFPMYFRVFSKFKNIKN